MLRQKQNKTKQNKTKRRRHHDRPVLIWMLTRVIWGWYEILEMYKFNIVGSQKTWNEKRFILLTHDRREQKSLQ